jgi:hypothetical protein
MTQEIFTGLLASLILGVVSLVGCASGGGSSSTSAQAPAETSSTAPEGSAFSKVVMRSGEVEV